MDDPPSQDSVDPEEIEKQVHSAIEHIRSKFRREMTVSQEPPDPEKPSEPA